MTNNSRGNETRREDGVEYVTRVIELRNCRWCGKTMGRRAEGRPRVFCSPACRVRQNRHPGRRAV